MSDLRKKNHKNKIIYCKDCKYSYTFDLWEITIESRYCKILRFGLTKETDLLVEDNDFCSFAKRRI